MPRLQPKFRSLLSSLYRRLERLACGRNNTAVYTVFDDQDDVGDDGRRPASESTEKLELVNSDPPTVSVETMEVSSELFDADDPDYIYHQMRTIHANPVPHEITGGDRLLQHLCQADSYLAEFMRREGRGRYTADTCFGCPTPLFGSGYRCKDCFDDALYCAACIKSNHRRQCLHRIQRWNANHFDDGVTLKDIGLRIQMGHPLGERCHNPMKAHDDNFAVIDTTGIHDVGVDFCCCETAIAPHLQLLRYGWFPDTSIRPKIAATFSLLEAFHLLSNQSKVSVFQFYISLARRTDNTGVFLQQDCYPAFYFIVREWRHIKLMKRAGRGNDPGGIAATPLGACAVECPACPHPEMNVPEDWKSVPPKKSWLHRVFVSIDATFRLMGTKHAVNPGLHRYKPCGSRCDHDDMIDDHEKHCNLDDAVKLATIGGSAGLSATSVAAMDHGQHGIRLPVGVSDLKKEEHQANIETPFALSTEMPPGSGFDALDDLFGDQNWRKATAMPAMFLSHIKLAVHERDMDINAFNALTRLIDSDRTTMWYSMVKAWEADPKRAPNPYEAKRSDLSQNALQAELAKQDAANVREGGVGVHEYTVTTMLKTGLSLEEQQRRLKADIAVLGPRSTAFQGGKLLKERKELSRRIATFRDMQKLFTPSVGIWRARFATQFTAETVPLLLPSALCALGASIDPDILDREWRLREAQAHDALAGLRVQLEVRAFLFKCKDAQVREEHVWENARSTSLIKSIDAEIGAAALRYRVAFLALSSLDVALDKRHRKHSLRELDDKDIQPILADDRSGKNGKISWIWLTSDVNLQEVGEEGNHDLHEALRIEWCQSRARALRWGEQCKLLQVEMRRVIAFHGRKAEWWEDYVGLNFQEQPEYLEGANAYAYRQAAIRRAMRDHCRDVWRLVFVDVALGVTADSAPLCDGNNDDDYKKSINALSTSQAIYGDSIFEQGIGMVTSEESIKE